MKKYILNILLLLQNVYLIIADTGVDLVAGFGFPSILSS